MRRIARVDAPQALVRRIFHDAEDWPSWMPGVSACDAVEIRGAERRFRVRQNVLGREWRQTVEIDFDAERINVRALDGWLQYTLDWRFTVPPGDSGTTLTLDVEAETGLFGFANRRLFESISSRRFDETVAAIARRAKTLRARQLSAELPKPALGRRLVAVYETEEGYEVWYEGRKYVEKRDDPGAA